MSPTLTYHLMGHSRLLLLSRSPTPTVRNLAPTFSHPFLNFSIPVYIDSGSELSTDNSESHRKQLYQLEYNAYMHIKPLYCLCQEPYSLHSSWELPGSEPLPQPSQ